MQNNSLRNYLVGQSGLFSDENKTSSTEVHLKRDRYGSHVYSLPTISYNKAQGNNGLKSYIPDETVDAKVSQLNQANQEMDQAYEQDMEIGYEDSPPTPTYEGLEQRFIDEIMKLVRERSDIEDAEFARHNERMVEINKEYQEKLSSLRARQATQREEFLHKESQERLNQYQHGKRNHCPSMKVEDAHGYSCPSTTFTLGEATSSTRFHGASEYKHVKEPTECSTSTSSVIKRSQRNEWRPVLTYFLILLHLHSHGVRTDIPIMYVVTNHAQKRDWILSCEIFTLGGKVESPPSKKRDKHMGIYSLFNIIYVVSCCCNSMRIEVL